MRIFSALFLYMLCPFLLNAQCIPAEYYSFLKKIETKDTVGLYSVLLSEGKNNPGCLYHLLAKGDYFLAQGNLKESLNNYSAALTFVNNGPKDTTYALVNSKIGSFHYFNNNYPEALKYINRATLIYNYKAETIQQAKLFQNLGTIHIGLPSVGESVKCFRTAQEFYRKRNDSARVAQIQNNIAVAYTSMNDFELAKKYLDSSLAFRKRRGDHYGMGQGYNNYGALYFQMSEYQRALYFYKLGYENRMIAKVGPGGTIESKINIGKSHFRLGDHRNALIWLEEGLDEAKAVRHYEHQKRASEELKDLYFQMKNYIQAYKIQEFYFKVNDSLYGMDKMNMVENLVLQNQFETKIRQDSISNYEQIRLDQTVAEEKEKRNTILFLVLAIGIVFLLVFVFQLYKSNANKKKTNLIILEQRDALDNKQKEIIDSIRYAKRIQESLLTTERYIQKNMDRLKKDKK